MEEDAEDRVRWSKMEQEKNVTQLKINELHFISQMLMVKIKF